MNTSTTEISSRLNGHIELLSQYGSINGSNCDELCDNVFASFMDIDRCDMEGVALPMGPLLNLVYRIGNLAMEIPAYFPEKEDAVRHIFLRMGKIVRSAERKSPTYSPAAFKLKDELCRRSKMRSMIYNPVFTEEDRQRCLAAADKGETSCRLVIEGLEEFAGNAFSQGEFAGAGAAAAVAVELLGRENSEIRQAGARIGMMERISEGGQI